MARRGGRHGSPLSGPAAISAVEKQRRVLELRKTGMSFSKIAALVGYKSLSGCHAAFQKALRSTIQQPADEVRKLEVERLDALLEALWPEALGGNLHAVDRVLMVMQRRASYLGLDAPQKVDVEHRIRAAAEAEGLNPDEAVAEARRILKAGL